MERAAQSEGTPRQVLWGFTVVWVLGTAFSVLVTSLAFSGKLWDLGTDGELIVYNKGDVFCPPPMNGASIVNLWIK